MRLSVHLGDPANHPRYSVREIDPATTTIRSLDMEHRITGRCFEILSVSRADTGDLT